MYYQHENKFNGFYSKTCFGVAHSPNKIKNLIGSENIIKNSYRKEAYHSMDSIGFIDFMLKVKSLLDHAISPNEYEKNDKIILKYFQ